MSNVNKYYPGLKLRCVLIPNGIITIKELCTCGCGAWIFNYDGNKSGILSVSELDRFCKSIIKNSPDIQLRK